MLSKFYDIAALWNLNDAEEGTWNEVIEVFDGEDPYEVARQAMQSAEPPTYPDNYHIESCIEVSAAVHSIIVQLPKEIARQILQTELDNLG